MKEISQNLNYENILLKHGKCVVNSRKECDISTYIGDKKISAPVFPTNMPAIINEDICEIFDKSGWFYIFHRMCPPSQIQRFLYRVQKHKWNIASISIGVKNSDYELIDLIKENYTEDNLYITIDVALSWQDQVERMIKYVKEQLPSAYLIVGNGDHPDWIRWLEDLGVDAAKVILVCPKVVALDNLLALAQLLLVIYIKWRKLRIRLKLFLMEELLGVKQENPRLEILQKLFVLEQIM